MSEIASVKTEFEGETLDHAYLAPRVPGSPGVMIFPTVMGVSDLEIGFARQLADLGHAAMVVDLFGVPRGSPRETMFGEMGRLRGDRAALRRRVLALLDTFRSQSGVDGSRVAVTGYCFGGTCALDLARAGADVRGVASFHGVLDPPGLPPQPIAAKVAVYHGWDDPLAPPEAVLALASELSAAGCDWQVHAYGHVRHGFTNPAAAHMGVDAVAFDEAAARRSWQSLEAFLRELFEPHG